MRFACRLSIVGDDVMVRCVRNPTFPRFDIFDSQLRAHGFESLTVNRGLTAQLLEHLSSTSESITRFADRNVEYELLDAQLAHGVGALVLSFRLHSC